MARAIVKLSHGNLSNGPVARKPIRALPPTPIPNIPVSSNYPPQPKSRPEHDDPTRPRPTGSSQRFPAARFTRRDCPPPGRPSNPTHADALPPRSASRRGSQGRSHRPAHHRCWHPSPEPTLSQEKQTHRRSVLPRARAQLRPSRRPGHLRRDRPPPGGRNRTTSSPSNSASSCSTACSTSPATITRLTPAKWPKKKLAYAPNSNSLKA